MRASRWAMQFSRAHCLSSERTMCQGATLVSVAPSIRSCARIGVPPRVRFQVHRAEFPLAHGVLHAGEALVLFLLPDFQPALDQGDAPVDDVALERGAEVHPG